MTQSFDSLAPFKMRGWPVWRRRMIVWGVLALVALVALLLTWRAFFVYVPPGQHLVIISKDGASLPPGHVLAEPGEKGIQRQVQGEGWHFVTPIVHAVELEKNTTIPAGQLGIVTARGGEPLPAGQVLADEGFQGIQRRVLTPGSYRLNLRGYEVDVVDATEITPGHVGVIRRLLGQDAPPEENPAADDESVRLVEMDSNQKGVVKQVLHPGLYYLNTKLYEVVQAEVGIYQTSFLYSTNHQHDTAIKFLSRGGFDISMECTVEWEILPEDLPRIVAKYGSVAAVERTVIVPQAHAIGRDKGVDYTVQEFLEGAGRVKYQRDFTDELTRVAKAKGVQVRSAFIRDIVIPDAYLKPLREKQVAIETQITNKAKEATAQSEADVERERQMVDQRAAEVEAETKRIVAGVERDVENIALRTTAEVAKLDAEYAAQIAVNDTQRIKIEGGVLAQVQQLKETARSALFQLKMEVFQNDADAFLRYTLAQQLNPKLVLRLFHSGSGTFWTNLESKGLNFMLPVGGGATPAGPAKSEKSK